MARIDFEKLAKGSLFKQQIDDGKEVLSILEEIEKQFKDIASQSKKTLSVKQTFGSAEEINKINEEVEKINKVSEETVKLRRQLATQTAKLEASQGELGEEIAKTRVEQAELNKAQKEAAKEALGLVGEYQKQSKRLNELRKQFKDLRLEEGKSTKESRKLLKEITKLDRELKDVDASVGQFQRNVGNYSEAVDNATEKTLGWLSAITGVTLGIGGLNKAVESNEDASEKSAGVFAQLGAVVSTVGNRIGRAASNIFDLAKAAITGEGSFMQLLGTMNDLGNTFEGVVDESLQNADAAAQAAQAAFDLEKRQRFLREELANVTGELERQQAIAGDTTRSFDQQEAAAQRVARLQIERTSILRDIAQEELNILQTQLDARSKDANNRELLNEISEKQIELTELQNELDVAQIENNKVLREIQRDRFERELDFAIDAFDAQKTVNERLIADDRKTLADRQAIFERTVQLADSAFSEQIKLVEGFLGQQTDLQQLVLIEDERIIRERLRNLTADDVALGRILEIIRERKLVLQDLADAERDVADAVIEAGQRRTDALQNILQIQGQRQVDALNRELENEKLSAEQRIALLNQLFALRRQLLIDQATFEIATGDKTAEEIKAIEEQLQNDLLNLRADQIDQTTKLEAEAAQKRKEQAIETAIAITEAFLAGSQKRLEQIDKEISASEKREERLQELADQRTEDAQDNLAFEQRRQAELEAQRAKEVQRQKNIEIGLAALNRYSAAVQAGDPNPLGTTVRDLFGLKAAIQALLPFYHGTDDTGIGKGVLKDKYGNITGFTHENEQVWSVKDRSDVGFRDRDEIKNIVRGFDDGNLAAPASFDGIPSIVTHRFQSNDDLIASVRNVEKAIKQIDIPESHYSYDPFEKAMVYTIRKKMGTTRYHKKVGKLY